MSKKAEGFARFLGSRGVEEGKRMVFNKNDNRRKWMDGWMDP